MPDAGHGRAQLRLDTVERFTRSRVREQFDHDEPQR
jgi:hypothetical protein